MYANFNVEIVDNHSSYCMSCQNYRSGIGARMSGLSKNESYVIAFGMNSRGSQEIVLGALALQAKIIDEPVFVSLILMTVVTIVIAGPLMKYYLIKHNVSEDIKAKVTILAATGTIHLTSII